MSIMLMSRIFRMNIGGCNRKLLAVRLADFADDDGRGIYPGVDRLAQETELSERTVQRILADFEREGILVCRQRATGRPGVANRYDFDLARLYAYEAGKAKPESTAETGDSVSPVDTGERGDNRAERGDTGDGEGCHRDTRTVIEPPLEPSVERGRASEHGDGQEAKADERGESDASIERSFWRLVKDWPQLDGMPKKNSLIAWRKLSADERRQAAERFQDWLAFLKDRKKDYVPAPSTYFAEKLWQEIPEKPQTTAGPKLAAPYGKLWMTARIADLLRKAYGPISGLTAFEQSLVRAGKTTAEAIHREKVRRSGWKVVNAMHERAADAKGYPCSLDLLPISEGFRQVHRDGELYAAWRREHERRGWPFLDDTRPPEWVHFPAVADGWEADPDAAVRAAIDDFAAKLREVRGDEHAA
ncbi:helix-turn-helix protein [Rhizobium subbaraonis]|uniref:Helix-turn-helix protein n=1 Tax=Rhizobium subbaraonis TaxID=908946 RepID=A0A285V7C6_9HYPH|nr:helix-turn-helix domain-containing protein [Rhizobium subbaraonis]SOC48421.1 helix-turn-helix protein [Rhizobium subbaraonis]